MGYLSCNAESAIAACDSHNFKFTKTSKPSKNTTRPVKKILEFSYSDLLSSTNGFSQSHLLGKGSHGSVYRAHLGGGQLIAAVKRMKPVNHNNPAASNPAENEIEILSRVNSSRVVNILGYAVDANKSRLIVVEYMPNGSLFDLLHGSARVPGWSRRVRFGLQVAKAVHYLHSSDPPIIHRDVKSSNVMIDASFNARLSDFGLALRGHVEDVRVSCTPPAGTLGYLDPGYLAPGDLSTKSDVFSFGILLLEIISGRNAIDVNFSPPSVVDWALPAIRSGDFPAICDPRIGPPEDEAALMQLSLLAAKCVRSAAGKRPAMAEVVETLKHVLKRVSNPIWNNIGRRVDCVRDSTKYEPLDYEDGGEPIKAVKVSIRRNRKVSNAEEEVKMQTDLGRLITAKGSDRIGRSRSIGSFREIEFGTLDLDVDLGSNSSNSKKRGGLAVVMPTVRLRRSRSTGMLQSRNSSTRLFGSNDAIDVKVRFVRTPSGKEMQDYKLLKCDDSKL